MDNQIEIEVGRPNTIANQHLIDRQSKFLNFFFFFSLHDFIFLNKWNSFMNNASQPGIKTGIWNLLDGKIAQLNNNNNNKA